MLRALVVWPLSLVDQALRSNGFLLLEQRSPDRLHKDLTVRWEYYREKRGRGDHVIVVPIRIDGYPFLQIFIHFDVWNNRLGCTCEKRYGAGLDRLWARISLTYYRLLRAELSPVKARESVQEKGPLMEKL